jgi:hypothetical protein
MVIGDAHGFWPSLQVLLKAEKPNLVIQVGDLGYFPRLATGRDKAHPYDPALHLDTGGIPVRFADGNHEDHETLQRLAAGKLDPVEVAPAVFYQPRGSTMTLPDGRRVLFFGGAYSTDRHSRIQGRDWFPEELPTQADFDRLPEGRVDIVISHTCPSRFIGQLVGRLDRSGVYDKRDDPTCYLLDAVFDRYQPAQWFFGHWHWRFSAETDGCRWTALHRLPNLSLTDAYEPPLSAAWTWLPDMED